MYPDQPKRSSHLPDIVSVLLVLLKKLGPIEARTQDLLRVSGTWILVADPLSPVGPPRDRTCSGMSHGCSIGLGACPRDARTRGLCVNQNWLMHWCRSLWEPELWGPRLGGDPVPVVSAVGAECLFQGSQLPVKTICSTLGYEVLFLLMSPCVCDTRAKDCCYACIRNDRRAALAGPRCQPTLIKLS